MKIYRNTTEIADVYAKATSYTYEEINGAFLLYLEFDVRNPVGLEINDSVNYLGNKYYIRNQENISKIETSIGYEYRVTFYHDVYRLYDTVFWLYAQPDFGKYMSSYYADATQVMTLVVASLNRNDSGWTMGSTVATKTELFDFKDNLCGEVVEELASRFNCEFWVEGRTVNLGKRQYNSNGLILSQGAGGGFRNLSIMSQDETPPITRLYAYGSERNIYPLEYGSDYLMLPGGAKYIEKNVNKYGVRESIKQFEEVYPKKEFTVTAKIDDFTLQSTDIDFNLTDYLLQDIDAIATFQTGGLAGYDLTIKPGSWNNTTKQFVLLKNKEENALDVPGSIHFAVGDVFILTNIKMPQAYITIAENELLDEATKWLDEKCEKRIQLRAECDEIHFEQHNIFVACGQMVGIRDVKLDIDREIRAIAIKRYIEEPASVNPYRYEITLSDFLQSNGLRQLIDDVKDMPKQIDNALKPVKQFTRRTWQDVMEMKDMMFDPEGSFFTEIIQPLVVHTAQLIVGTNSQQMDFIGLYFIPNADDNPNLFKNTAGILEHFTINTDGTPRQWNVPAGSFSLNNNEAYYVYAKCEKDGTNGEIIVTTDKIKLEEVSGYYHFWVGVLNTPRDGVRSWQPNYGYTEIAGQQITTGVIKDKLSKLIIDLANSTIWAINGAKIIGRVEIISGSGVTNFDDWVTAKTEITNYIEALTDSLQNQIDGQIESWFYEYDPTLLNIPASSWVTTNDKEAHLGDTFTNLQTGASWRWSKSGSVYSWVVISDTATQQALVAAGKAQDTADNKRRVFTAVPPAYPLPPYDVGDLWTQGASGDILRCATAKTSTQFYASGDWVKTSKYTDDTALTTFVSTTYASDKATLQANIDGKIETWYQPSTQNPASSWAGTNASHTGDIWYRTDTKTSWRWSGTAWVMLTDADAEAAKALAEGKNTIFTTTPANYKTNDLWILASATTVNGVSYAAGEVLTSSGTSATYVQSHWTKRISYDGTKTTIDGGLVTTGTLQLAGTQISGSSSIVAGITGAGAGSATDVRIWAGSSFDTRGNAPFRVLQNGSLFATSATITGTITATSGSIGNFTISGGWLTCNSTSGTDGYINMRSSNTRIAFGYNLIPSTAPNFTCTAIIENKNNADGSNLNGYPTGNTVALSLEASGSTNSGGLTTSEPIALDAIGGIRYKGSYSGVKKNAELDYFTLANNASILKYYDTFVFQPTSSISRYLPTRSAIESAFGYFPCGASTGYRSYIEITLLVTRYATSSVTFYGDSTTPLLNPNGTAINFNNIAMNAGNILKLAYHNGAWYQVGRNW